jgi:DNA-binding transcriptional regulator of glucitol operon
MSASEPAAHAEPVWRFLLTPRWLSWHALMVVAFCGMGWLGYWQMTRALSGNGLSWAYTFEWPLFAVFAVVFWARTVRDELRIRSGTAEPAAAPVAVGLPAGVGMPLSAPPADPSPDEADDPALAAYNAYLARLHAEVKGHGRWHGLRS